MGFSLMVGRQFSFFLGPDDQFPFEEALKQSGPIAFLRDWPLSPVAEELQTSVVAAYGEEVLKVLIARRDDIDKIEFEPIKGRQEYSCNINSAPAVGFSRCYLTDRYIRPGRLYRVDRYYNENDELISKPDDFLEWSRRLYKLAKKSLTKLESPFYSGKQALEMRAAGEIVFENLDVPIGSLDG